MLCEKRSLAGRVDGCRKVRSTCSGVTSEITSLRICLLVDVHVKSEAYSGPNDFAARGHGECEHAWLPCHSN